MKSSAVRGAVKGCIGALIAIATLFPGFALGADIRCDGGRERPLTGNVSGNVTVPVGATCVIHKAEIFGNVRVYWNGSISISDTTIHGDFAATGAAVVRFNLSGEELGGLRGKVVVDGDVLIKEARFTQTSGFGGGTLIRQDLTLKRNRALEKGVVFVMCPENWCRKGEPLQVTGDVGIRWNQAPVEINNLHIGGDLNCRDNIGRIASPPNASAPVHDIRFRKATGQCAELAQR